MSVHTKGSWAVVGRNVLADGRIVATAQWPTKGGELPTQEQRPEVDANARLIAAAPDLLAALRELLTLGQQESIEDGELEAAQKAARAAIEKAVSP